jgi:integrase
LNEENLPVPRQPKLPKPWPRKDRNNDWYVTVKLPNGKQKQTYLAPADATPEEVRQALARKLLHVGVDTAGQDAAVLPLLDRFLTFVQRHQKPETYRLRKWHLQSFGTYLKGEALEAVAVRELRPFHVSRWLDANPQWNGSSRRGAINSLMAGLNWACREGYVDHNPLEKKVQRPPRRSRGREAYMDKDTYHEWLGFCRHAAQRHVLMALYNTGCRPDEVCSLGVAPGTGFDRARGVWAVQGKSTKANPSGLKLVALPPFLVELSRVLREKNPTGALFRNCAGTKWYPHLVGQMFRRFRRRSIRLHPERAAGLEKMIPYSGRHSWSTDRLREGWSETMVARQLGHSGTAILHEHYNHVLVDDVAKLMKDIKPLPGEEV